MMHRQHQQQQQALSWDPRQSTSGSGISTTTQIFQAQTICIMVVKNMFLAVVHQGFATPGTQSASATVQSTVPFPLKHACFTLAALKFTTTMFSSLLR
jgi:hypothetical protein